MAVRTAGEELDTGYPLSALFVEDNPADVELALRELRKTWADVRGDRVESAEALAGALSSRLYDVVLADYRLPGWNALEAMKIVRRSGKDVPVILVTGSLGEEQAVECVKSGITDYVLKTRLRRLPVVVRRALRERSLRAARRRAEAALKRSEATYRSLVRRATFGIARLNLAADHFVEVNPALIDLLRYADAASLARASFAREVCARAQEHAALVECCRARVIRNLEMGWKTRSGETVTVRLNGRCIGNKPVECELIVEDVTAARRDEARIAQLNRMYAVLSRVNEAIIRIRGRDELFAAVCRIAVEHGLFQMAWIGLLDPAAGAVAPAACAGHEAGYLDGIRMSAGDLAGLGPTGIAIRENRHWICEDIAAAPAMAPWRERALERGYRCCGAFPLCIRNRVIGGISLYCSEPRFFDAENVDLLDEMAADLSFALESMEADAERLRAEQELDQFFTLSPEMLCIIGRDGHARRVNSAWERTLGFTEAELAAQPLVEFIVPADRETARIELAKVASGVPAGGFEARFRCRDGGERWLVLNAAPSADKIFLTARDVTERKRLEEQLRRKNQELVAQNRRVQAANRMKSQFLANMSHELRSPLNCIIGFTELLYDGRLGAVAAEHQEYLGDILESARHLLRLINDVLDLSKIESGRMDFHAEPVELSRLVREVADVLRAVSTLKRIQVDIQVAPEAGAANLDPARFKQVLYNFLSNAYKFTPEGGRVTIRILPEGEDAFRLEVEDTGIGIAAEHIPHLFVEFQQLDASAAKRYQGSGLGLALTRRLVELQGGRVGVRSTPGRGSLFFAVLPRRARQAPAEAGPVILVMEDDPEERNWIAGLLRSAGYTVETAATAAEAVLKANTAALGAIILDLLLPDANAWDALRGVRAQPRNHDVPVIIVSAIESRGVAAMFPINGFLTKPVNRNDLTAALERVGVHPTGVPHAATTA